MPDVELHDLALAWPVWQRIRATGWRWTVADVLAQPEPITSDVFAIEFAYARRKEQDHP